MMISCRENALLPLMEHGGRDSLDPGVGGVALNVLLDVKVE
jgi:hypothetical protein